MDKTYELMGAKEEAFQRLSLSEKYFFSMPEVCSCLLIEKAQNTFISWIPNTCNFLGLKRTSSTRSYRV
jgi:hypothetical protein